MEATQSLHVWDLPTRVFHWLLAAAIPAAIATGMIGGELMVWHGRLGLLILGLLTFRLLWGFIGARHARFVHFVRGPRAIRAYLRGEWRGVGHNPLGALSVLAMLALIGLQVGSGLFANDDIAFRGPLADAVRDDTSSRLTWLHALLQYGLIAMVVVHALAIAWYLKVKRDNLVKPMVTGWKEVPASQIAGLPASPAPSAQAVRSARLRSLFALTLSVAFAAVVVTLAAGQLLSPAPPPAAPVAAPGW